MSTYLVFKQAISVSRCKSRKSLPRKRARRCLAASTSHSPGTSRRGSSVLSNPGTPTSKKMRKIPKKIKNFS